MEYETILLTKADGVATITLNRPEVLNAMSFQLIGELDRAITDVEADDQIGSVIITGAGERAFSAGADIHEQRRDVQELSPEEIEERRAIRSEYSWHMGICSKAHHRGAERPVLRGRRRSVLIPGHAGRMRAQYLPLPCGLLWQAELYLGPCPTQIGWPHGQGVAVHRQGGFRRGGLPDGPAQSTLCPRTRLWTRQRR